MLVYGDHDEIVNGGEWLESIWRRLCGASAAAPGIERHAMLVSALVDLGRLLQGVADADFASTGKDRRITLTDRLGDWLTALAGQVWRSWQSGFIAAVHLPAIQPIDLPTRISLRLPEGFAFYSVYPEAYGEAAQRLTLHAPPLVIGIRSIGSSLGAVTAAALGAGWPVTVRPTGDPLARHLSITDDLAQELLAREFHYVVIN